MIPVSVVSLVIVVIAMNIVAYNGSSECSAGSIVVLKGYWTVV